MPSSQGRLSQPLQLRQHALAILFKILLLYPFLLHFLVPEVICLFVFVFIIHIPLQECKLLKTWTLHTDTSSKMGYTFLYDCYVIVVTLKISIK